MPSIVAVAASPHLISLPQDSLPRPELEQNHDDQATTMAQSQNISTPSKPRSLSGPPKPSLSPSPAIRESARTVKDDSVFASPSTPKRPNFGIRGLSLQMPPREANTSSSNFAARVPLSPKLDRSQTQASPGSMLPRRSRGLDFARACTNLHHSTLAESSPDSSPTISGRGLMIPQRKIMGGLNMVDSPSHITSSMWSAEPQSNKLIPSSSVSSTSMLDVDDNSSNSSDDDPLDKDEEDAMFSTPHASKLSSNFISGPLQSPGGDWMGNQFSPAAASLMSFQRARLRKARSRHSSSSGNSSKPSPAPLSPPLMKSVETNTTNYFQPGLTREQVQSRRESLSLGTGDLHLSDSGDDDGKASDGREASGNNTSASSTQSPRGVIRRPVTRRSNLLPKTKTFARIRAALIEESAPVENEAKREADVIHQVRESDPAVSSPRRRSVIPAPNFGSNLEDELNTSDPQSLAGAFANSFHRHAVKNSDGVGFWNNFERQHQTPPPSLKSRHSSSAMSLDTNMESNYGSQTANAGIGIFTGLQQSDSRSESRSSTPMANGAPTAGEAARNANNRKRGRDDDLDPASFKRRAVSPGMSVQSSPVLPQSPGFSGDKQWGQMHRSKAGGERSNSGGGGSSNKRVGLQGMVDTNDGIMNMSIE